METTIEFIKTMKKNLDSLESKLQDQDRHWGGKVQKSCDHIIETASISISTDEDDDDEVSIYQGLRVEVLLDWDSLEIDSMEYGFSVTNFNIEGELLKKAEEKKGNKIKILERLKDLTSKIEALPD
tara:strand:+ start:1044 stop:1421 length:378 start_codon:yes stop_codon:yes gene_type:complete